MSKPFIVLGDRHSHGGTVTSASAVSSVQNRGIARRNDTVSCPLHGSNHIVDGDDTMIVQGQAVARDGHKTACDALKKVHTQSVAGQPDMAPYGLVSDADQRNATRKEIVTLAERLWQDEAQARSHHLGLANGTSSPALALATLAVAAERVNATSQPILAALLGDTHARGAMLVVPADSVQPTLAGQTPPVLANAPEQSAA